MDIKEIIKRFLKEELPQKLEALNNKDADIYNEFSLQHELGIYLREKLGNKYKVQFERNAKKLWDEFKKDDWKKTEMDIFVYKKNNKKEVKDIDEIYAIELKYPKNGQYPEQMYSFIKDIKFMQQVKEKKRFARTFVLTLVNHPNFYRKTDKKKGEKENEIYKYFRCKDKNISLSTETIEAEKILPRKVKKPTGQDNKIENSQHEKSQKVKSIILNQQLTQIIKWELISSNYRYYFMEI